MITRKSKIGAKRNKKIVKGTTISRNRNKASKSKINPKSLKIKGMASRRTAGNSNSPIKDSATIKKILIILLLNHHKAINKNNKHPAAAIQNKILKNMTARTTGNKTGETTSAIPQTMILSKKEGAYLIPIKITKGNSNNHPSTIITLKKKLTTTNNKYHNPTILSRSKKSQKTT